MAKVNQATMKAVNVHQSKIDAVKFDGTNNFSMWRWDDECVGRTEYKKALKLQQKPEDILEKD